MKTTAKWISENHFILNNSKYLNIAVTDPLSRDDNYELNCLDLVLMGFAGCVTAEFKKEIGKHSIALHDLVTDVSIEKVKSTHPNFVIHLECKVNSSAHIEFLEECLEKAINTSLLGILFKKSGVEIHSTILTPTPTHLA
jgi:uncharacterized OsmC-like protein